MEAHPGRHVLHIPCFFALVKMTIWHTYEPCVRNYTHNERTTRYIWNEIRAWNYRLLPHFLMEYILTFFKSINFIYKKYILISLTEYTLIFQRSIYWTFIERVHTQFILKGIYTVFAWSIYWHLNWYVYTFIRNRYYLF